MSEVSCDACDKRDECKTPCRAVKAHLWAGNRVMERHFDDRIVCYPKRQEVHFSELEDYQVEAFSDDDVFPWSSGDFRLRKTTVFVERFFNKVPCKELAERFGVKENTIVSIYKQAVEQIEKLLDVLDSRKVGLKAMKPDRFTEDQKLFLLAHVFGFTQAELARMFKKDPNNVCQKVKRLADQYGAAFEQAAAG